MKKLSKIFAAALILVAAVMSLCACGGLDMSKVKGDWTLSTINGKAPSALADEQEKPVEAINMNYTLTDDSFTVKTYSSSTTCKIDVKSNGFEVLNDDKSIMMSVKYDSDKDELSYVISVDGTEYTYVLKKGTSNIEVNTEAAEDGEEAGEDGEEAAEE